MNVKTDLAHKCAKILGGHMPADVKMGTSRQIPKILMAHVAMV